MGKEKLLRYGPWVLLVLLNAYLLLVTIGRVRAVGRSLHAFSLRRLGLFPGHVRVQDLDGDRRDELIVVHNTGEINPPRIEVTVFRPFAPASDLEFFAQFRIPAGQYYLRAYYDQNRKNYLYQFLEVRPDAMILNTYDNRGSRIHSVPFETIRFQESLGKSRISTIHLMDINGDQKEEMVLHFKAGWELFPRGFVVYEMATGRKLWEYFMGSMPTSFEIVDFDQDGHQELICATFAANNGVAYNGLDDSHSYLILIDDQGTERWRLQLGGWYSRLFLTTADMNGDGIPEIIVTRESHRALYREPAFVKIYRWEDGQEIASFYMRETSFFDPSVVEVDGRKYIAVSDSDGRIWVLDARLRVVRRVQLEHPVHFMNRRVSQDTWPYLLGGC